jgi:hypothetical protein
MSKCTVIRMIVFDGAIGLCHDLFKSLDSQNRLVPCVILHQMDVDKITYVITKCSATLNAATCEEAGHLRD